MTDPWLASVKLRRSPTALVLTSTFFPSQWSLAAEIDDSAETCIFNNKFVYIVPIKDQMQASAVFAAVKDRLFGTFRARRAFISPDQTTSRTLRRLPHLGLGLTDLGHHLVTTTHGYQMLMNETSFAYLHENSQGISLAQACIL